VAFSSESRPESAEPATGAMSAPVRAAEEKAIRETAEAFTSAFNKGDAKAVAALWTTAGEYIDETGLETRGRDAIEKGICRVLSV
jgi:uncharacterized protein (TIGR02246 family)